ncbi:arylsulfatase [Paramicrobacterium agarici]|uniref:arylsulfatase n=1 Tax=Paramicrobacterium agarici TaxID=630514 RepID=UPI001173B959|nr:arylsulfatase [Microbacterium agarici]TQO22753.1 arylsulfatase [Microbacterium agarici]
MRENKPNILVILADDLGYSDIGCFGGEILTPHIDSLAADGVRLRDFHNTPRCSPSRASLLTGLHPHQAGIGILTGDDSDDGGYRGNLNPDVLTIAEILKDAGYETAARGKWHLAADMHTPNGAWPTERGFDSFWGTLTGCGSYYRPGTLTRDLADASHEATDPEFFYTDRIAEESVSFLRNRDRDRPFFLYAPFTAPHWPLHAREATIAKYRAVYARGWDELRDERFERQISLGVLSPGTPLTERDPSVPEWANEPNKEWQIERMSVYAAMVEEMDSAVGTILNELKDQNVRENTIVVFLSDNGASADPVPLIELEYFRERLDILNQRTKDGRSVDVGNDPRIMPGGEESYQSYGRAWANLSNTPYRLYKLWAHEGGIAAPFIFSWPEGDLPTGGVVDGAFQLTHVLPTLLEAAHVDAPASLPSNSILSTLRGAEVSDPQPLWWEHCGNAAYRKGNWKLVREHGFTWELYDMSTDRSETIDVASQHPELVVELADEWQKTADSVGVIPFQKTLDIYRKRGLGWTSAVG